MWISMIRLSRYVMYKEHVFVNIVPREIGSVKRLEGQGDVGGEEAAAVAATGRAAAAATSAAA